MPTATPNSANLSNAIITDQGTPSSINLQVSNAISGSNNELLRDAVPTNTNTRLNNAPPSNVNRSLNGNVQNNGILPSSNSAQNNFITRNGITSRGAVSYVENFHAENGYTRQAVPDMHNGYINYVDPSNVGPSNPGDFQQFPLSNAPREHELMISRTSLDLPPSGS